MALNAKLKTYDDGSESQTENMALNAKLWRDNGSECQTEKRWWL